MTDLYGFNMHVIKMYMERKTHYLVCSKYASIVSPHSYFMICLLEIRTGGLSSEGLENVWNCVYYCTSSFYSRSSLCEDQVSHLVRSRDCTQRYLIHLLFCWLDSICYIIAASIITAFHTKGKPKCVKQVGSPSPRSGFHSAHLRLIATRVGYFPPEASSPGPFWVLSQGYSQLLLAFMAWVGPVFLA